MRAAGREIKRGDDTGSITVVKGSRRNKFTILGVEASDWQGAKTQEYLDIPSFRNAARRDASAYKM
jgi:hypothetical protein